MTRPAFGGNLMATIMCTENRPQMSTVRPGVFDKLEEDKSRVDAAKVEKVAVNLTEADLKVKVEEVVKIAKEVADIGEADILVAGGRGVRSEERRVGKECRS